MRQKAISLLLIIMIGIQSFGLVFAEDVPAAVKIPPLDYSEIIFNVDTPCGLNFSLPDNADYFTLYYSEETKEGVYSNKIDLEIHKEDFNSYYNSSNNCYQYLSPSTYEDYLKNNIDSITFIIHVFDSNRKMIGSAILSHLGLQNSIHQNSQWIYSGDKRSHDLYAIIDHDVKLEKIVFPSELSGSYLCQDGRKIQNGDTIMGSTQDNLSFVYIDGLPIELKSNNTYEIYIYERKQSNKIVLNIISLKVLDKVVPPTPTIPPTSPQSTPRVTIPEVTTDVIVNGVSMSVGYGSYFNNNVGESMAKIKLDTDKVIDKIDKENLAEVSVSFTGHKDHYQSEMNVALIDDFASKGGQFTMKTSASDYLLPMSALSMEDLMTDIPDYVGLEDVSVFVEVKEPDKYMQQKIDNHFNLPGESEDKYKDTSLDKKELLVNPVSYNVYTIYNGKANDIDLFKQFVTRLIPLEKDMDESQMTTAIVIRSNGTYYSVPSKVIEKDGKKYLEIKSLTNGIYSALENKVTVTDMAGHWAREAVEHLGSRMILYIQPDGAFYPNALTPSNDFSEALMRTMGLDTSEDWQETMSQLKLGDKSLLNQDTISREQAMTLMANALATTSDYKALTDEKVKNILSDYADGSSISAGNQEAVATCIEYQLISGNANHHLLPQGQVTNAQMAVMLDQLLSQL